MSGYLTPTRSFVEANPRNKSCDDLSIHVLRSPVQAFKYENSRRYHSYREGSYWGPNDEQDALHQTVTHRLFSLLLNDKLYLAPLASPRNVLDIGTGIGLWTTNMADAHPTAEILGIDLSPTWHDPLRPNLRLEVDDCCSNWTYADEGRDAFDLVHIRCLYGSIHDWSRLYQQALEHLKPGAGYIEQAEISLVPQFCSLGGHEDSVFVEWYEFWRECSRKMGKSWFVADDMARLIYDAGFEDVCETRFLLPLFGGNDNDHDHDHDDYDGHDDVTENNMCNSSTRRREITRWFKQFWETGMEGWILATSTRYMGWTADQAREFVKRTRDALMNGESDVYYEMVIVYGRRPES